MQFGKQTRETSLARPSLDLPPVWFSFPRKCGDGARACKPGAAGGPCFCEIFQPFQETEARSDPWAEVISSERGIAGLRGAGRRRGSSEQTAEPDWGRVNDRHGSGGSEDEGTSVKSQLQPSGSRRPILASDSGARLATCTEGQERPQGDVPQLTTRILTVGAG